MRRSHVVVGWRFKDTLDPTAISLFRALDPNKGGIMNIEQNERSKPALHSVAWMDVCLGDKVYIYPNSSPFNVKSIDNVVGIDFDKGLLGQNIIDLNTTEVLPFPEPRLKLEMSWGSWYGYWYPYRQRFVKINNDSNVWEIIMGINEVHTLMVESTS